MTINPTIALRLQFLMHVVRKECRQEIEQREGANNAPHTPLCCNTIQS